MRPSGAGPERSPRGRGATGVDYSGMERIATATTHKIVAVESARQRSTVAAQRQILVGGGSPQIRHD